MTIFKTSGQAYNYKERRNLPEIIGLYYQWSPAIVRAMTENEKFKEAVKELVYGVAGMIAKVVEQQTRVEKEVIAL